MTVPRTLSVVIPAYNEARRLPGTLERVVRFLDTQGCPAEVVVADDGSTDATADVVRAAAGTPRVRIHLVRLPENRGKGAAVRAGVAATNGDLVLISDADLATPIEEVDKLIAARVDVAVGSRGLDRTVIARRQPLLRDLLGRTFNLALRLLGLTRLHDTQCGFKLLEGSLARRLGAALRLDGFAFDVELLARAAAAGVTIAEVPVVWYHVEESRVRPFHHGLRMVLDAVRIRFWLWSGR